MSTCSLLKISGLSMADKNAIVSQNCLAQSGRQRAAAMLILVSCLIKIGGSYLRQVPLTGLSRLLSDYAPAIAAGASNSKEVLQ